MKPSNASFTIKPFKNRNGVVFYRVAGKLLGERIRKNFKSRELAIVGRGVLELKQAQANSDLRVTSTFLTEPQLREAEAAFLKLKDRERPLTFYLDVGLENHREPKTSHPLDDAVVSYLAERAKDVKHKAIGQRQHDSIRIEMTLFKDCFSKHSVGDLTEAKLLEYIRKGGAKARTQNNRSALLCTFFKYACTQGWLAANPLAAVKRCRVGHCRGSAPAITSTQADELMAHVETVENGAFVPFFALCLFAGIRPNGEISKLPAADVRAKNASIVIEPQVSKVNMRRLITIQPNLAAWLAAYPLDKYPIIPTKMKNLRGKLTRLRRKFSLEHDVLRHTFISMHVAKFRSMGDTALQAGNSEKIIQRHYLNVITQQEAEAFFAITPRRKEQEPNAATAPVATPVDAPAITPAAACHEPRPLAA